MVKYRFASEDDDDEEDYKESKRIRQSLLLYTSSFYICWIIPLILWYAPHDMPYLYIIGDVLFSLMGFFNVLVYVHPRCAKYRKEYPGTSLFKCYAVIFFVTPYESAKKHATELNVMDGINLTFYEGLGGGRRSTVNLRSMRGSIDIHDACISTTSSVEVDGSLGDNGTDATLLAGLGLARETKAGESFLNQESALESTKELHDNCISTTHSVEVDTPLGGTDEADAPLSAGLDQAPELEAGDSSSTVNMLSVVESRLDQFREVEAWESFLNHVSALEQTNDHDYRVATTNSTEGNGPLGGTDGADATLSVGLDQARELKADDLSPMVNLESVIESNDLRDDRISTTHPIDNGSTGDNGTDAPLSTRLDQAREAEAGESSPDQEPVLESTKELHGNCISTTHSVETDAPLGGTDEADGPLSAGLDQAPELEAGDSSSTVNMLSVVESRLDQFREAEAGESSLIRNQR